MNDVWGWIYIVAGIVASVLVLIYIVGPMLFIATIGRFFKANYPSMQRTLSTDEKRAGVASMCTIAIFILFPIFLILTGMSLIGVAISKWLIIGLIVLQMLSVFGMWFGKSR